MIRKQQGWYLKWRFVSFLFHCLLLKVLKILNHKAVWKCVFSLMNSYLDLLKITVYTFYNGMENITSQKSRRIFRCFGSLDHTVHDESMRRLQFKAEENTALSSPGRQSSFRHPPQPFIFVWPRGPFGPKNAFWTRHASVHQFIKPTSEPAIHEATYPSNGFPWEESGIFYLQGWLIFYVELVGKCSM